MTLPRTRRVISDLKEAFNDLCKKGFTSTKTIHEAIDLGITHLWFQPGSESDELEQLLRESHGIKYLINSCIMVETK